MAGIASCSGPNVATHAAVVASGFTLPMLMAINATEHRSRAGGMALHAIKSAVLAAVNRETVVESAVAPRHRIVAIHTSGWETGRLVIRIGGALIIGKVASHAGRADSVVIKVCA